MLRYAFVYHRTSHEAERNLRRPIASDLLGRNCRVEYANNCSRRCDNDEIFDTKKVVITGIPQNVSEHDLRHLFVNCHILSYCTARDIQKTIMTTTIEKKRKTLWGYENLVLYIIANEIQ